MFPTQGSNPCLLRWQVDSLLLNHLGSPDSLHQMWLEKWLDLDSKKTSFPAPSPIILILYCFHNLSHVLCHVLQQRLLLNADCSWCGHCAHCPPRAYLWWKACPGPEGWHSRKQRWSVAELNKQLCVLFVFSLWTMRAHSCLAWHTDACGTGLGAMETITPNGTKPSLVFFAICSPPSLEQNHGHPSFPPCLPSHPVDRSHSLTWLARGRGSLCWDAVL